jgi:hypothetical protein
MKIYSILLILCLTFFSFSGAMAQSDTTQPVEMSKKILNHLLAGEYEEVSSHFDDKVKASLSTEQLKQVWEGLTKQVGAFQASKGITTEESQGHQVVTNTLEFEKSTIGLRLAYNENNQVSNFFLVPAE